MITPSTESFIKRTSQGLTSVQAKLFSNYTLRENSADDRTILQSGDAEKQRSEALRIASAGISAEAGGDHKLSKMAFQRAAELFEWLIPEKIDGDDSMLSAAFYQLSELPAMAQSILASEKSSSVFSTFLSSDFHEFERISRSQSTIFGITLNDELVDNPERLIAQSFLASLNIVVANIKWGDDRISNALQELNIVEEYFRLSSAPNSWLLAYAFKKIAGRYSENSLRVNISEISGQLANSGKAALERYLRKAYQGKKGLAWPTQRRGLKQLALNKNFALCTPTGSGKTAVAEIAIIQALFRESVSNAFVGFGQIVLYIVPSRALAAEVEKRLVTSFGDKSGFPIQIVCSYGGNDFSGSENWVFSQVGTVIVCTQEKADALLRSSGPMFANRITTVIIDEAHAVALKGSSSERPLRLESLIARIRLLRSDEVRLVALSAVLGADDNSLGTWLHAGDNETVRVPYQSTRRLFGKLTVTSTGNFIAEYSLVNGSLVAQDASNSENPRIPGIVPKINSFPQPKLDVRTRKWSGADLQMRSCALWAAINLTAIASSSKSAVLITVGSKIEDYAELFLKNLESWEEKPEFFNKPTKGIAKSSYDSALDACRDYFGAHSFEFRLLTFGIVVHHGQLPVSLSRVFIALIEMSVIRICLATSTLSEGINLPFDTILLPNLRGHLGSDRISAEEIRNVVGRAGRPGLAREGRALVMMGEGDAFRYNRLLFDSLLSELGGISTPAQPSSALSHIIALIHDKWSAIESQMSFIDWVESITTKEIVGLGQSASDALEDLDVLVISALVEHVEILGSSIESASDEEIIKQLWQYTYAAAVSNSKKELDVLIARSRRLRVRDNFLEFKSIYKTAMRPSSARILVANRESLMKIVHEASSFHSWTMLQRIEFVCKLISALSIIPQCDMSTKLLSKDPEIFDLLSWWVGEYSLQVPSKKIGRWYKLANSILVYGFTWSLSSVLLQLIPENLSSFESLESVFSEADVPLVYQWFRDMMLVGVLDPVAAVLMQRGLTKTRSEASAIAGRFYHQFEQVDESCFQREVIDSWIRLYFARAAPETSVMVNIEVSEQAKLDSASYRVSPEKALNGTLWREASGFPVAFSNGMFDQSSEWTDYTFVVNEARIYATSYLSVENS